MSESLTVLLKTAAMFLVILVGWIARRRGYLSGDTGTVLGRLVVDLAYPALVLTQIPKTLAPQALRAEWYVPLLGIAVLAVSALAGTALRPLFVKRKEGPTFAFLTATPNWIYLPLPIAEVLYGAAGVRTVILFNVGFQITFWTLNVWIIRGRRFDLRALRDLILNPGLLATLAGVALAVWLPSLQTAQAHPQTSSVGLLSLSVLFQALEILGSLTIPLSLVVTGAQLSSLPVSALHVPSRDLAGVVLARLVVAPVLFAFALRLAQAAGWAIPDVPRLVAFLISAMPVAVSASVFMERFHGDVALGARAILFSTLWSLLSVPAEFWLFRTLGW